MCSQLSLVEQKKLQWAKEREEMMGLSGMWGTYNQTELRSSKKILPPLRPETNTREIKTEDESETSGYLSDSPKHSTTVEDNFSWPTPESVVSTPDDRLKWGDRGIGIGHLWEPVIDRPESRLPQESQRSTPRWVERFANDGQSADILYLQHEENPQVKNFLLGQNVPLPPEILEEREKRRRKAMEHQNAIRRQLEEREKKRKEEKEARSREERLEEERLQKEREIERLQLENEKKKNAEKEKREKEKELLMEEVLKKAKKDVTNKVKKEDCFVVEVEKKISEEKTLKTSYCQTEYQPAKETITVENGVQTNLEFLPQVCVNPAVSLIRQKRVLTPSKYRMQQFLTEVSTQTEKRERSVRSRRRCSKKICSGCSSLSDRSNSSEQTCVTCSYGGCSALKRYCVQRVRLPLNERPKWGINRPVVQYKKQSEKDPHYMHRIRRRARKTTDLPESISEKLLQSDRQFLPFPTDDESKDRAEHILQNGFRMVSNPSSPQFVRIDAPKRLLSLPNNFDCNNCEIRTPPELNEKFDDLVISDVSSNDPQTNNFVAEHSSTNTTEDNIESQQSDYEEPILQSVSNSEEQILNQLQNHELNEENSSEFIDDVDEDDVVYAHSTSNDVLKQIGRLKKGLRKLQEECNISSRSSSPSSTSR